MQVRILSLLNGSEMNGNQHHRNGLSLFEVIVILLCLIVLASLFLPAVRNGRDDAAGIQCLNNIRNVTVAIHGFASSNKSRLPAQAYYPSKVSSNSDEQEFYEGHSWVVSLIPYLDHCDWYDQWDFDKPWDSTVERVAGNGSNTSLAYMTLPTLTCPRDPVSFQQNGGLSYAVNCGIGDLAWHTQTGIRQPGRVHSGQHHLSEPFDWNGNGILPPEDLEDSAITRDFTLFSPQIGNSKSAEVGIPSSHSLDKITDGTSNTIMLGENINAGARPGGTRLSWADPQVCSNGLILPIDARRLAPDAHASDGTLAALVMTKPTNPGINRALNAGKGNAPFVNSNHQGGAVVAFMDGAAMTISEDIDMGVYSRLLTPCGTREREVTSFVPEEPIANDSF